MLVLTLVHYLIVPISMKSLLWIIPITLMIIGGIGYYNYRYSDIVNTKISLDKSAEIEKIKIAFIADLHLYTTSNKNLFIEMVEKINNQNPDIILMGGDILQNSYTKVDKEFKDILAGLKSKYGTYAILGNHEYYGNDVTDNLEYFKDIGIKIIRDEVVKIGGVNFIGRDDIRRDYTKGKRKTLPEIYKENNILLSEPIIVIDHNPQSIMQTTKEGVDIQLSAHTHAGQFFPYNLLLKSRLANAYGYKKIDGLHTVVTSGVGVGFWKIVGPWQMPYRFGTNSEINIIEVDFKN